MSRQFGGLLFFGPNIIQPYSGGVVPTTQTVLTRQAKGDISWNQIASQTVQYTANITDVKRPYITFPTPGLQGTFPTSNEFQELFGTAAGGPSNPFGGGGAGSVFQTPNFPFGLAIIDIFAIYSVTTANLTSATLGVSRQVYANNAAFTITDVIAATATGKTVTTTSASTPYVATITATQPLVFESTDLSDLVMELILVSPATSTARVYGMGMHVAVEY